MPGRPKAREKAKREGRWDPVKTVAPEVAGALIADLVANPEATLNELAEHHGLGKATVSAFLDALRTTHVAMYETAREVSAGELLPMIETRLKQVLQFMSPEKMAVASVRDLAVAAGILVEKRALMRGEPTQIIQGDDRKKLHDLMPYVLREAARRGMILEGEYRDMTEAEAGVADPGTRVLSTDPVTDYVPNRSAAAKARSGKGGRGRPAAVVKDGEVAPMRTPGR